MKKLFILTVAAFIGLSASASAEAPKLLGEYNDWSAFYYQDGKKFVCYMASSPQKDEGKYSQRGDIYVVITHRPGEKSFDVVNFVAGYTYKPDAKVTVKIGKTTIDKMFVDKDKAWAVSENIDKELVDAMKKGERMIVSGESSKGTETKDTYSLSGFASAYKAISAKCRR